MPKSFQILVRISFAFIVIVIGNYVIAAQTALTGTWRANDRERSNARDWNGDELNPKAQIYLDFKYQSPNGGDNSNGSSYAYADLGGLTESQVSGADSSVKFSIVREAGTIECEGSFQNGQGSGTFRFTASPQFITAMKTRGFDFTAPAKHERYNNIENRLFTAMTINVTTALADDLLSADFGRLEVDDLFKAAIFKIDSKFAREMKATNYPNLSFDDLVKAKIFKIDPAYVKQVAGIGSKDRDFENLVKLKIFKITPEYIAEVRGAGFANLDIEDLVQMRIFNIDSQFIQKAKADGVPLNVGDLVQRRIGVWRR